MTGDRLQDITEATACHDYFDGLVFVDHMSKDGTYELLESRKKDGLIIRRPYFKQHSHSQNEVLFSRHIRNGDWIFWIDSPERIKPYWLEIMRSQIKDAEAANIGAFCFSGRPYLWKYFDKQCFIGSPHWGVFGIEGKIVSYGDDNKHLYLENKRDEKPEESYCLHPIKYWFCFNPSNECQIMYAQFGQEIHQKHEEIRQRFRLYCEDVLNISLENLDDLIKYMEKVNNKEIKIDSYFLEICEQEFRLIDLFRLKVLQQDFIKEIVPNRYSWSLKRYLETKDIEQKNKLHKCAMKIYQEILGIKEG